MTGLWHDVPQECTFFKPSFGRMTETVRLAAVSSPTSQVSLSLRAY